MKVSVITRHAITNYGSLLQSMATQIILNRLGVECEIVDYIRKDETYWQNELTLLKQKPEWYGNLVKRILYLLLRMPESIIAGKKFEKQRKRFLNQSDKYESLTELNMNPPQADVYMTGSDQVWGPVEDGSYDSAYFLSYAPKGKKCVSFAASFGRTSATPELQKFLQKWITRYNEVTVREDSAREILKKLGIYAEQVLDPTLLLDASDWTPYINKVSQKKKYVLIYQIHNDPKVGTYAKKYAKEKGLKLLRVSPAFHQINRPGKLIWCPSVGKFLGYIAGAECLITDSFHGTAFAINFNIPFVELLPNNGTKTRNVGLLKDLLLEDRILSEMNETDLLNKGIDYDKVNNLLQDKRARSIKILKKMLRQCEGA